MHTFHVMNKSSLVHRGVIGNWPANDTRTLEQTVFIQRLTKNLENTTEKLITPVSNRNRVGSRFSGDRHTNDYSNFSGAHMPALYAQSLSQTLMLSHTHTLSSSFLFT